MRPINTHIGSNRMVCVRNYTNKPFRKWCNQHLDTNHISMSYYVCYYNDRINTLFVMFWVWCVILGDPLLHTTMAVEVLGGRQDTCADDGSGHWHLLGDREEAKENVTTRLFVGKPKVRSKVFILVSLYSPIANITLTILFSPPPFQGITIGGHIGTMCANSCLWWM